MRYALINPSWSFEGSVYFGCRHPHLPLELGYAQSLLEKEGHDVLLIDGHAHSLSPERIGKSVEAFRPDFTVITTAPTYLFWRCPQPELRVPAQLAAVLRKHAGVLIAVGPHGSSTPVSTLRKLGADFVVLGECEELLAQFSRRPVEDLASVCFSDSRGIRIQGGPHVSDMKKLPALRWPGDRIVKHSHHHHRFDAAPSGPGAEMETSRGCPYQCSFCAKQNFRGRYRKRSISIVLEELDGLLAQGVRYIYFIDEIFFPDAGLLEAFVARDFLFGIQARIDHWPPDMLSLLGRAGCVSVEAGVESISEEGRLRLNKPSRISGPEITERLIEARRHIPFVQANLICTPSDRHDSIEAWRAELMKCGVWANKPVPLFPYPGSPGYSAKWGPPGDTAWERACEEYLASYTEYSDIQCAEPLPLVSLEAECSR